MDDVREINGFPRYGVDKHGCVYSRVNDEWAIKTQSTAANGYRTVGLWNNGKERRAYVHHLVLEAFVGARPDRHEALHGDGIRTNNALTNLRWGTRSENVADMVKHGTATIGARNAKAKLTALDVLWLRDMRDMGFTPTEAARIFRVSTTTIWRVFTNQTYQEA